MNASSVLDRPTGLDAVNRPMYASHAIVQQFAEASGWLDEGERVSLQRAARDAGAGPVLDIGVGGGRTTPLLREICPHYIGVDYTPDMVREARRRFPDVDFREMDARALEFADSSFRLVNFSYNGIDSVDMEGRARVLREVWRVLQPGGVFAFSALNRHGPAHVDRLEVVRGNRRGGLTRLLMPLLLARRFVVSALRRLQHRRFVRIGEAVSVLNIPAHNYALVAVFVSVTEQVRELREAGFVVEAVYDDAGGTELPADADNRTAAWCYYVARRPGGAAPADAGGRA